MDGGKNPCCEGMAIHNGARFPFFVLVQTLEVQRWEVGGGGVFVDTG